MSHSTLAEFSLDGAGSGVSVEVEIDFDIEPGSSGSWDEPPYGPTPIKIAVTRWRFSSRRDVWSDWVPAEGPMLAAIEACIDDEWLLECADGCDDGCDDDDRGDWQRDMRDERMAAE